MEKTKNKLWFYLAVPCAIVMLVLVIIPPQAKADIFEVNNPGSCAGGGSAGGGLCYFNGKTFVPFSLSGLLSGAYGSINVGSGTTMFVVKDDITGGAFSYTYSSTTQANNATCQINGGTTAYFAASSIGCMIVDGKGNTNTGTLNATKAFNTGAQINTLAPPAKITFYATGGYGQTFDIGFVSMQGNGTPSAVPEPSSFALLGIGLLGIAVLSLRKI